MESYDVGVYYKWTDLGFIGFSTAQRSGLTLKPCSIRPIVNGNAPPARKHLKKKEKKFLNICDLLWENVH